MLTLEEAIKHCHEKAEENRKKADEWYAGGCSFAQAEGNDCLECAKEHEQLAKWLTELQDFKNSQSQLEYEKRMLEYEKRIAWAVTNITPDEITFQGKRYILKEEE